MHPYTNKLIAETSPYLLQHAHNPVDWYPWGEEAFALAKKEDKPMMVSIGYAACHWCHVMERESFENVEVAHIMNENFINIKVDREERPDVDHIYMDAVQAMTGSGGWPLNVFLTPDGKPFYGGTYFPPQRAFNRSSWSEVLQAVAKAYKEKKDELESQAENLTAHLRASNGFGINSEAAADTIFDPEKITEAFKNCMKNADRQWGGFGAAPKFPQTFTITFLLRYAYFTQNQEALQQALLSINKMIQGGIYDHIGGGFARYSTDKEWLAPHFEKMLYDNALLVSVLAEAYQLTHNKEYEEVIEATLKFVERELMHPEGGFYSALDADSEGEEGKFYVWSYEEVKETIGGGYEIFCQYFDITPAGNWEHKNILRILKPLASFAEEQAITVDELKSIINQGKEKLLQKRSIRPRPLLDDKILLSWNALMNTAYSKAYEATGNERYKQVAEANMNFLLQKFTNVGDSFFHSWKSDKARHPAFLDDYSYLISALISLAQVTYNYQYLQKAKEILNTVLVNFADTSSPFFFYTHMHQKDILLRKKEIYDGATPSGNAVMALNLYQLSIFFDEPVWRSKAADMLISIGDATVKYPTSFGVWLALLFEMVQGTNEIAVLGSQYITYIKEIFQEYIPHKVVMAAAQPLNEYPLLKDKPVDSTEQTWLYLCKDYACLQPVTRVNDLLKLVTSNNLKNIQ